MTEDERSLERAISEQHRHLDAMFEEILVALREGEALEAIRSSFEGLREAVESHIDQEDRLYYPSLRAMRPAHRGVLDGLVFAHDGFRKRLEEIDVGLSTGDRMIAERNLGAFVAEFAGHEAVEEQLLRLIDAEIHSA